MSTPSPIAFFQRPYPSANALLLRGERPVLVDGGFGADVPVLVAWLHAEGVPPERLALVVNTHFDCDHAGANHALADQYGLPIATHRIEAAMVNARDAEACRARYLHQPVEPYRVAWSLEDGDIVDTGAVRWTVISTPGHTEGHISLHAPEHGLLVTGDAVLPGDVGWIDATRPDMLDAAEATTRRLAGLRAAFAWSGHGPVLADPAAAMEDAARRLTGWRRAPERMAWHGAKRVFAYGLMVGNGIDEADLVPYLLASPWFQGYAAMLFRVEPVELVAPLMVEMLRSNAARWEGGRLVAGTAFIPPAARMGAGRNGASPMAEVTFRTATRQDVPAIVAMLADDLLGQSRESPGDPAYLAAFEAIEASPNDRLVVAEADGRVVGCLQLTFLPGLSLRGAWRGQIEAVRVARDCRGSGIGRQMLVWAIEQCRMKGCRIVQLTTNASRTDAARFYASLGFTASRVGMKREL